MVRVEEIRIDTRHLSLGAKRWGDASLPPLIAIHGWLDNAGSFDRLAPLLASERHVVALDLPGHGRSQHRPPGTRYHFVDYFDELREVFDRMAWTRAGLLGHSLGGAIGALFAAAFPELIDELLLIEGLGPLTVAPHDAIKQLRKAIDQRRAPRGNGPRVYPDAAAAAEVRQRANALSNAAAETLMIRGLTPVDGGVTWSSDPRLMLASPQRFTEDAVVAMLGNIRAPTLLVIAEPETHLVGADAMSRRIAQVPGIEVVRVPGNHHVHLEHAEAVAEPMLRFLRRSASRHADARSDQSAGA